LASNTTERSLNDYPHVRTENVRYGDTDRQGHVNNAVFSTFFECSRTDILYDPRRNLITADREFVIVKFEVEYLAELGWPGTVEIGTRVARLGRSSIVCEQAIFQNGVCAAASSNVMVMIDVETRKSAALPDEVALVFGDLMVG
jgi:acyl-CoA thioester hydrolase|tara:strand:- start:151 stop:582 length:432 start_codon:yes stop_codon:yes gene_type:complete